MFNHFFLGWELGGVLPKPIELIRVQTPNLLTLIPSYPTFLQVQAFNLHGLWPLASQTWGSFLAAMNLQIFSSGLVEQQASLVNKISVSENNYREGFATPGSKGACKSALLFLNKKWKGSGETPAEVYVPSNYFLSISTLEAHLPNCQAEQACQSCCSTVCVHVRGCVYMCAMCIHACMFFMCVSVPMCFPLDELLDQNTAICFYT